MDRDKRFFSKPGIIGVTGHRLNRLTVDMQTNLAARLASLFADPHEKTRLISCLADGTDLIAAKAWPYNRHLDILLPVSVATWRQIVAPLIPACELDPMFARASVTCLTDQTQPDYAALADELVMRSDRILAIWDGEPGKPGGTGTVVARARAQGKEIHVIPLESLKGDRTLRSGPGAI